MNESNPDVRTVVVERDMPHPPDKVWRALTQPHLISEWLMKTDFRPERGHSFSMRGDWGGVECKVLEIEPHSTLSYTWDHAHDDRAFALKSVVTFTLTPTEAGTRVRMEQTGFRPDQRQALGGAQFGWQQHLENLEKAVSRLE
ncbi:SRPBCC family protein [Pelagibacterium montanilacus]|uniref:SRPBCC family protein n=1 Tax=Pelagibacterium montanilacus TaxID=2185280 RepID=UPI000F8E7CEF|nr:SRPBCC domain-containing protein [Pelagibacterium montanilacus]